MSTELAQIKSASRPGGGRHSPPSTGTRGLLKAAAEDEAELQRALEEEEAALAAEEAALDAEEAAEAARVAAAAAEAAQAKAHAAGRGKMPMFRRAGSSLLRAQVATTSTSAACSIGVPPPPPSLVGANSVSRGGVGGASSQAACGPAAPAAPARARSFQDLVGAASLSASAGTAVANAGSTLGPLGSTLGMHPQQSQVGGGGFAQGFSSSGGGFVTGGAHGSPKQVTNASIDERLANLMRRFPQCSETEIREALEASGGHAGMAAGMLSTRALEAGAIAAAIGPPSPVAHTAIAPNAIADVASAAKSAAAAAAANSAAAAAAAASVSPSAAPTLLERVASAPLLGALPSVGLSGLDAGEMQMVDAHAPSGTRLRALLEEATTSGETDAASVVTMARNIGDVTLPRFTVAHYTQMWEARLGAKRVKEGAAMVPVQPAAVQPAVVQPAAVQQPMGVESVTPQITSAMVEAMAEAKPEVKADAGGGEHPASALVNRGEGAGAAAGGAAGGVPNDLSEPSAAESSSDVICDDAALRTSSGGVTGFTATSWTPSSESPPRAVENAVEASAEHREAGWEW